MVETSLDCYIGKDVFNGISGSLFIVDEEDFWIEHKIDREELLMKVFISCSLFVW